MNKTIIIEKIEQGEKSDRYLTVDGEKYYDKDKKIKTPGTYEVDYYENEYNGTMFKWVNKVTLTMNTPTAPIQPVTQQTIPTAHTYKPEVVGKDRMIVRQSSLKVASDILKIKYSTTLPKDGFEEEIFELAEKYEQWVFR